MRGSRFFNCHVASVRGVALPLRLFSCNNLLTCHLSWFLLIPLDLFALLILIFSANPESVLPFSREGSLWLRLIFWNSLPSSLGCFSFSQSSFLCFFVSSFSS